MLNILKYLDPDRNAFEADPVGYSSLALIKWGLAQTVAGFPVDIEKPPTTSDLNSPVLWLTHAHAISEAARIVIQGQPELQHLPRNVSGVCDSQYCAVGLMLVAYSLEVSLKAMLIMKKGVTEYLAEEKQHRHHRLEELAAFIPELDGKDRAILRALTHFSVWAGRYPDPGSGRERGAQELFELSEKYKISGKDLFQVSARVTGYATKLVKETPQC